MIKTKIIETTEKYDKDGKLVEKITREETTEDDTVYESGAIYYPQVPALEKGGICSQLDNKESKELKITF